MPGCRPQSVSGRFCSDRPPRHSFFSVSLCLKANAEMAPNTARCHYKHLMWPSGSKFSSNCIYVNSGFGGLVVSMLPSGTQHHGFAPDRSRRIFPAGKIHSMPSFGRGSKIICPMLVTHTTKR
jgi:hypothetical protein